MNTGELTDKISDKFCCRKFFVVIESNNCVFLTALNCFGLTLVMVTSFKSTRKLSLLCAFNEAQRQFKARHKMHTLKTDMFFLHKIITNNYSERTIICTNTGNKNNYNLIALWLHIPKATNMLLLAGLLTYLFRQPSHYY